MHADVGPDPTMEPTDDGRSMTVLWLKTGIVTVGFLALIIWVAWWARSVEEQE